MKGWNSDLGKYLTLTVKTRIKFDTNLTRDEASWFWKRVGEWLLLHMFYIHEQNKSISYFCWFVSSRILIHNLETFTFPSTTRLHAIKKQELYTSFLRRYRHIHVDISPVLGRGVCLMCNSGCVCLGVLSLCNYVHHFPWYNY